MSDTITITLSKPVAGPDGDIKELTFREPTGADVERHGNPVRIENAGQDDARIEFNTKAMGGMLAALSGQTPVIIGRLGSNDWITAGWAVSGFFVPLPETVSS